MDGASSQMLNKNILGYISLVFVLISEVPYTYLIIKGNVKPHAFSRILWFMLMAIAAIAQYSANAGPGAWATIVGTVFFGAEAVLSFSHGERTITRSDWIFFVAGLSTLPIWYFTSDPLLAIILVSLIDAIGYYSTFRKLWIKPKEEAAFLYTLGNVKHIMSVSAMATYSATTLIYPLTLFTMNSALVIMLLWRRHALSQLPTNQS